MSEASLELVRLFATDRWAAHRHLFRHRHTEESPQAHEELVRAIHAPLPRLSIEGFRTFGKTTFVEEAVILKAELREFHYLVWVSSSYAMAAKRVDTLRNEFEVNTYLEAMFGSPRGENWGDGFFTLSNGVAIEALGRGQSMLGLKYRQWRPDAFVVDDFEDPEEKLTDPEREEAWRWLLRTFQPALADPLRTWGRFIGTRRGVGSLPERLEKSGVPTVKYPIEHIDAEGKRAATWPAAYPLAKIDEMKDLYRADPDLWSQEYMCIATSAADRTFTRDMIRVSPRVRQPWQAVYAMLDPARTTGQRSATTGWAVWSWIERRLVVWAADASRMLPDEIIALIFTVADSFDPVWIGFEEDGLNEWAMQPIRHEMVRRHRYVPVKAVRAPKGKHAFIRGLQHFFMAGEVEFGQELKMLTEQLLSFPHGAIDAPNALAYAPLLRSGMPVYDEFAQEHAASATPDPTPTIPTFVAANATSSLLAGALVQLYEGRLLVFADWLYEGAPTEMAARLAEAANLAIEEGKTAAAAPARAWDSMLKQAVEAYRPREMLWRPEPPVWVVPQYHNDRWTNVGLLQAARAVPTETRIGGDLAKGRAALKDLLARRLGGMPLVEIGPQATWTLRALSGGYARAVRASGGLASVAGEAEPGPYRVLMEALESFVALATMRRAAEEQDDAPPNFAYDRLGRRYLSAMPARK